MAINPVSFKQLPYDPTKDFTAVAMVSSLGPQMLSVNADVPVQSVPEFLAFAKQQRDKFSIAFDTTAAAQHRRPVHLNQQTLEVGRRA